MSYDRANEVIQELCEGLVSRYKTALEESMKSCDFICDCINLLH